MPSIGVLLGKSPHKDSADDVAEWKGLLTRREILQRDSYREQGREPPRLASDLILLRYLRQAARVWTRAGSKEGRLYPDIRFEALDSHALKAQSPARILAAFDRFDIILLLTTTFMYESRTRRAYADFYAVLQKTRAWVYPSPQYLRFLFDKSRYMKRLRSAGIPIIPTEFWTGRSRRKHATADWDSARSELRSYGKTWRTSRLVLKGSHSAGKAMMMECDLDRSGAWPDLRDWLDFVFLDLDMPGVLIQPYLEAFAAGQEIRTYWIREEFAYALVTGQFPEHQPTEIKTVDGRIHPIIKALLPLGRRILSLLPDDGARPKILVRIDFVMPVHPQTPAPHPSSAPHPWLVNEIEMLEACLFPDWTSYDVIQELGEALLDACLRQGTRT